MNILGVIPARYASTRFPAKSLALLEGKSMIERVYQQAIQSHHLNKVVVATDDQRIFDHVSAFGEVCMTADTHVSGTDRCFEALNHQTEKYDYVINIQGDEPFIAPQQIDLLANLLDGKTELATLCIQISDSEHLFNPNVVKVTRNALHEALYFSRSAIPHLRNIPEPEWITHHAFLKHIGLYAYRSDILEKITRLPVSSLEKAESLEQLRWIENGFRIKMAETQLETLGIDTPEDLQKAVAYLKSQA